MRVRSLRAGIAGFYTPTGAGTMIHLGGVPLKYEPRTRKVAYTSKPKESRVVNGRTYVYEEAITGEFALVKAWRADKNGNLMFRYTSTAHLHLFPTRTYEYTRLALPVLHTCLRLPLPLPLPLCVEPPDRSLHSLAILELRL